MYVDKHYHVYIISGARSTNDTDEETAVPASPPPLTPTKARHPSVKGVPSPLEVTARPASVCYFRMNILLLYTSTY